MPNEPITVGVNRGERIERITVTGAKTDWSHDDRLFVYDDDGQEVGEFPRAEFAVHAEHLE